MPSSAATMVAWKCRAPRPPCGSAPSHARSCSVLRQFSLAGGYGGRFGGCVPCAETAGAGCVARASVVRGASGAGDAAGICAAGVSAAGVSAAGVPVIAGGGRAASVGVGSIGATSVGAFASVTGGVGAGWVGAGGVAVAAAGAGTGGRCRSGCRNRLRLASRRLLSRLVSFEGGRGFDLSGSNAGRDSGEQDGGGGGQRSIS